MGETVKPGLSPAALLAAVVLIVWEAVLLAVLTWTGVVGWMLDYYREVLGGL